MADSEDDEALNAKLAKLKSALAARRKADRPDDSRAEAGAPNSDSSAASGMSLGLKAASEFIAAVMVGVGIGWGLDRLFGTKPLFLLVFFFLGVVSGVWNVIRATSR